MTLLVLLALGALTQQLGLAAGLDRFLLDRGLAFNREHHPLPVAQDPVLVGIDEAFVDGIDEPLTLSHVYLARFLDAMVLAQASVVGIDLALPEKGFESMRPTTGPGLDFHRLLAAAQLRTASTMPVVAAKVWDADRARFRNIHVDYATALALHARGVEPHASAIFCSDPDARIRRYPGPGCQPGGSDVTFSGEIQAASGAGRNWDGLINFQLGPAFSYIPLQQVLALQAASDSAGLQGLFEGKTVLLGTVLDDADLLELPVALAAWLPGATRLPGVIAHAQTLRSMRNGGLIHPVSPAWVLLSSAGFALFWLRRSVVAKLFVFAAAALGLSWLSLQLLLAGHWLPPGAALVSGLVATAGRGGLESWRTLRDKRRLTRTFSGYVSPAVMKEIVAGGLGAESKGLKLPVCVLFSDIRGFTTLSERLPAEEVVGLLNRYFARMTHVVHRHEGTVDKFIGDGLMAFFGAPNALPCPEKNAFAAAQAMLASLAELNAQLLSEDRPPLAIGIGLHSGVAVIGHIGSPERNAYTAIGDTVNMSARLESLCKELGYPVLCSQPVADAVGTQWALDPLGNQALKGHSPAKVFGWRPAAAAPAPGAIAAAPETERNQHVHS
ncbi:MAG: hypothetical protein NVS3B2_01430 [Ramlibacter sp.]